MIAVETMNIQPGFELAYLRCQSESDRIILFVHGFGSAKEHFRHAFSSPELDGFSLIAPDLVGFGKSKGPDSFGYKMRDQASVILQLLDQLKAGPVHLCAHSMGGLVAMHIAELEPDRVQSFIDMEGNLTIEDCSFTGKVASHSFEEFAGGERLKMEKEFRDAGMNDPTLAEYADTFSMASTKALYKSACHTVKESGTSLIPRLLKIKNGCYIYGKNNRGLYPAEKVLLASRIPVFYIENASHTMALQNPGQLYRVIRTFIDGLS